MLRSGTVFDWLKRKGKPAPVPLTGAPPVRRQKTHSALSGYVYQYYYEGHRSGVVRGEQAEEFVFDVSADRRTSQPLSIFVPRGAVRAWEAAHGRELTGTEQYAIAKMALFQAFDERENPERMQAPVIVDAAAVDSILSTLEID
jgi:hypothetical protein